MMMSVMLVGGMLLATPVSAQMSNRRPAPGGGSATVSSRGGGPAARPSASSSASERRGNEGSRVASTTRSAGGASSVSGDRRGSNGGSSYGSGNDRRPGGNSGNGGSSYGSGNDRRPGGNGGSSYGSGNDRRPGGNGGNHYGNDHRPNTHYGDRGHNAYRDHYSWNHAHNNWSRPLPPPARAHRPAPYYYHRPHVPVGYRPYYGAPVIDRILGITFGTMFNASLSFLYTNGYNIDGYENGVVYLRSVNMLNLSWPDVMLYYDDAGRFMNAHFIHSSYYNDRSRYNRLYNDLCLTYGTPVEIDGRGVTWFGGNTTGYVTLSMTSQGGRFYTNLYIGY